MTRTFVPHLILNQTDFSDSPAKLKTSAVTRVTLTSSSVLLRPSPRLLPVTSLFSLDISPPLSPPHYLLSLWWPLYVADLDRNGSVRQEHPARNNISQQMKKIASVPCWWDVKCVRDRDRKVSSEEGFVFRATQDNKSRFPRWLNFSSLVEQNKSCFYPGTF